MGTLRALIERTARTAVSGRQYVLAVALALVVLSPTWILGIRVHADTAALVPRDDPVVAAYRRFVQQFGEPNDLVLRIPMAAEDTSRFDEWAEALAAEMSVWPDIIGVRSTQTPGDPLVAAWQVRAGLVNAGAPGRDALLEVSDPGAGRRAALRARRRVLTVADPDARRAATADPLGVVEIAAASLSEKLPPFRFSPGSNFLDSDDGSARLLIVRPAGSAEDGAYCRSLLARIEEAATATALSSGLAVPRVEFAGLHALTAETMDVAVGDLRLVTLAAVAGLLLLLWACFGSWYWLLLVFGPLLVAQVVFLGLVRLAFGPINYLSLGFAAVVLGLGLDFALHLAARLDQCRERMVPREAIIRVMGDAGPPIVIAGLTTMAAFACLSFSTIPYLVQFGLLTSAGLLVTLLVTMAIFPALATWAPMTTRRLSLRSPLGTVAKSTAVLLSRRSGVFAFLGATLAGFSLLWAAGFQFEMDLMRLFPRDLPAKDVQEALEEEFGGFGGTPLLLTLTGPDLESALSAQADLDAQLLEERGAGRVVGFMSPTAWLVPPDVDLGPADWETLAGGATATVAGLRDAFEDLGLRWDSVMERYRTLVLAAVSPQGRIETPADLENAPSALRQVLSIDEGVVALGTRVIVSNVEDKLADATAVRRLADDLARFALPAGIQLEVAALTDVYGRFNESIRTEFLRLSGIALVVVLILVALFLRDPRMALVCFVPLVAAVPATLALARLGGIALMPVTVGFVAAVIGIGIDDAIHLVVRRVEQPQRPVAAILEEILPVITLTTASTALGFGALTLSTLGPTRSIGAVTASGVLFAWLFTWLLLPWLLQRRPRGLRPAPPGTHQEPPGGTLLLLPLFLLAGSQIVSPAREVPVAPELTAAQSQAEEPNLGTEQLLEELQNSLDSMEAVTADFRQRVSYEQLTGEVELEGTLFFQKPNLFRLELQGEQNLRVLSDGEQIWLVDLDLEEVEVWDVAEIEAAERLTRLFPLLNVFTPEEMQRDFEVTSVAAERGEHRLSLVPRDSSHPMARMVIELDGRFRPVWTRVEYPNGDSLEIDFDGWDRRGAVSRHFFQEIRD